MQIQVGNKYENGFGAVIAITKAPTEKSAWFEDSLGNRYHETGEMVRSSSRPEYNLVSEINPAQKGPPVDILEQLATNIADWPELLPRSSMVSIAAGTVTQAHNEIARLRSALRKCKDLCAGEAYPNSSRDIQTSTTRGEIMDIADIALRQTK